MSAPTIPVLQASGPRVVPGFGYGARQIVAHNFLVYRRAWVVFLTGFLEPVFYLLSIGIGVGGLVDDFRLDDGRVISYAAFVAPALLASSAMNGALFDSTYGIFFRFKYDKLYDSLTVTPLTPAQIATGELTWALLRGTCYSVAFVVVMAGVGLIESWWGLLAVPATMLIAFAFGGAGMALTTFMKSWQDFEYIALTIIPMFLFSATFYPLTVYPEVLQWVVRATPLYQGVVLCRGLSTGDLAADAAVAIVYLLVMGSAGLWLASRRLAGLLLT